MAHSMTQLQEAGTWLIKRKIQELRERVSLAGERHNSPEETAETTEGATVDEVNPFPDKPTSDMSLSALVRPYGISKSRAYRSRVVVSRSSRIAPSGVTP
jgi:hypothetical protein